MITVVIVTHNRAAILSHCLNSLAVHATRCEGWRVLVVDNASSDGTASLVDGFRQRCRNFDYVREARLGASCARNRGTAETSTPYVLFVDDECTFPPGYLDVACELIEQRQPACFGGPIGPWFLPAPPRPGWYKDEYGSFSLPRNNPPDGPPRLSAGNLGASRAALQEVGGFDEGLGPVGGRMSYGEENALVSVMWDKFGPERVLYEPRLKCLHLVRPEKFAWRQIMAENLRRGLARGRLSAAGLGEQQRLRVVEPAVAVDAAPAHQSAGSRAGGALLDLAMDVTLLRLLTEPGNYRCWQQVVYERWMGYVRWLGLCTGLLIGRSVGRLRKTGDMSD